MKFRGRSGRGQLEGDSGGNRGSCVEGVTAAIISGVTVTFGPFEVDSDRRLLLKNGDEVHLTPKAFDLLAVLLPKRRVSFARRSCIAVCGRTRSSPTRHLSA